LGDERQGGARCAQCAGALQPDQRYCLECGARSGSRDPRLENLLAPLGASVAPPRPASGAAQRPARHPPARSLARPLIRIWVPLTLAFLGFGVVLGDAASPSVQTTLAASSALPAQAAAPSSAPGEAPGTNGSPQGEKGSASTGSEAPSSEAESSPAPAASAPAAKPTSASGSTKKGKPSSEKGRPPESSSSQSASGATSKLPAIKHVFVIMLSDQPYAPVFGPASQAPYLAHTLERGGELLVRYYAVAHEQLANEIALLSGQGPTPQTAANCATYADVEAPGAMQAGSGCVYPRATQTLMGQLQTLHLSSRAYVQGLDEGRRAPCAHPTIGEADPSAAPTGGAYATFRNPFVYFRSVTDVKSCRSEDVGLDKLTGDLSAAARTPSLSYIVPDRCHDGNPVPCAPAAAAGPAAADGFLRRVVPGILASKAYKQRGLLVITVDEAPSSGELADSSSCCGQPRFPLAATASGAGAPAGGGQVGALLLSPFVKPGSVSQEPYNHFSLLRTFEDLFGVSHLGYAGGAHVRPLEPSLFSAKRG
jgi:phosphatidylinositol-3-phosphatase